MPGIEYDILYQNSAYNTAVAASGSENIISNVEDRRKYGPFNHLYVKARDAVDIKIVLDGNASVAGSIFELAAGDTLILDPEDGFSFTYIQQTNLSSTTAEVANKILFRWARMVPKGTGPISKNKYGGSAGV